MSKSFYQKVGKSLAEEVFDIRNDVKRTENKNYETNKEKNVWRNKKKNEKFIKVDYLSHLSLSKSKNS